MRTTAFILTLVLGTSTLAACGSLPDPNASAPTATSTGTTTSTATAAAPAQPPVIVTVNNTQNNGSEAPAAAPPAAPLAVARGDSEGTVRAVLGEPDRVADCGGTEGWWWDSYCVGFDGDGRAATQYNVPADKLDLSSWSQEQ